MSISQGKIVYLNNDLPSKREGSSEFIVEGNYKVETLISDDLDTVEWSNGDHLFLRVDDTYDPVEIVQRYGNELKYSFVNENTKQVISSHFPGQRGDRVNHLSHHNLSKKAYVFQKRIVDIVMCSTLILPLCVYQIIIKQKITLHRWLAIIGGQHTIVGYKVSKGDIECVRLLPSLISCYAKTDSLKVRKEKMMHYSLHYSIFDDVYLILMNLRGLLSACTYGEIKK